MIGTGQSLELPLTTVLLKPICTVNVAAAHLFFRIFLEKGKIMKHNMMFSVTSHAHTLSRVSIINDWKHQLRCALSLFDGPTDYQGY